MSDNRSLLQQLANRAKAWHSSTGISQSMMASAIGLEAGNYSAFLAGKKGIGSEATCRLLKFVALPKREAIATFSAPVRSSKILELQEKGYRRTHFDDSGSWVPGLSGIDPAGTTGIDDTPDADELPEHDHYLDETIDTLRQVRQIHRSAIKVINQFIQSSKVNQGSTAPTGQKFSNRRK
jgi:hypothetical protein